MTAVDKHQFRHCAHVVNLARAEERIARKHHAPRVDELLRWVATLLRHRPRHLGRLAMTGDVHDAPVALHQCIDDGECVGAELLWVVRADQRFHLLCAERL